MLGYLRSPIVRHVLAFCVAFGASRWLFALANFHYDVLSEPFNIAKFAVDFGVWVMLYMVTYRALTRGVKQQAAK